MSGATARTLGFIAGATVALVALIRLWLPSPGTTAADPAAGRDVFHGRGRCATCHAVAGRGGIRCPDLGPLPVPLLERAATRVPGLGGMDYLIQSLLSPDSHTVDGYPRGLMPEPAAPPIGLAAAELEAVVAYLVSADGRTLGRATRREIAAAFRRQRAAAAAGATVRGGSAVVSAPGDPNAGLLVWERMRCGVCHVIAGLTPAEDSEAASRRGPELTGIGSIQTEAYLEQAVWEPDAVVIAGAAREYVSDDGRTSRMPSYREIMTREELRDLVAFLALQ